MRTEYVEGQVGNLPLSFCQIKLFCKTVVERGNYRPMA